MGHSEPEQPVWMSLRPLHIPDAGRSAQGQAHEKSWLALLCWLEPHTIGHILATPHVAEANLLRCRLSPPGTVVAVGRSAWFVEVKIIRLLLALFVCPLIQPWNK